MVRLIHALENTTEVHLGHGCCSLESGSFSLGLSQNSASLQCMHGCTYTCQWAMIMEYCSGGDLQQALLPQPEVSSQLQCYSSKSFHVQATTGSVLAFSAALCNHCDWCQGRRVVQACRFSES